MPVLAPSENATARPDTILAEWAVGYSNAQFVMDRVLPLVPVDQLSDTYPVFGKEAFRHHDLTADARSDVTEIGYQVSTEPFTLKGKAAKHFVGDDEDTAPAFDRRRDGSDVVMEAVYLDREVRAVNFVLDTGNYPVDCVVTAAQDIGADDTKLLSWLKGEQEDVRARIGRRPNKWAIGPDVWTVLAEHPNLLARLGANERGALTRQMVADLLELDEIIVVETMVDTAAAGQTPDLADVWTAEHGLLFYSAPASTDQYNRPTVSLRTPTFGKMPFWRKLAGGVGGVRTRRWRDEGKGTGGGEWVQAAQFNGMVLTCPDACVLHTNLLGSS